MRITDDVFPGKQDGYLLVSSDSSTSSVQLCSSSDSAFISDAAAQIYSSYNHSFSGTMQDAALITGHNIVATHGAALSTSTTGEYMLNVASLSRGQLYWKFDCMCDLMFVMTILTVTSLIVYTNTISKRAECRRNDETLQRLCGPEQCNNGTSIKDHIEELRLSVNDHVMALECKVRDTVKQANENKLKLQSVDVQEAAVSARMRELAVVFMQDGKCGQNPITRVELEILSNTMINRCLKWLWSFLQSARSDVAANAMILSGIVLELSAEDENSVAVFVLQAIIVFWLGVDTWCNYMYALISDHRSSRRTQHASRIMPILWILLVASCFSSSSYSDRAWFGRLKHYLYPIIAVARNDLVWQSVIAFFNSMKSASYVLLLFWCLLLSTTAISKLMLQGAREKVDLDFAVSYQYADFTNAFCSMFIYLSSG